MFRNIGLQDMATHHHHQSRLITRLHCCLCSTFWLWLQCLELTLRLRCHSCQFQFQLDMFRSCLTFRNCHPFSHFCNRRLALQELFIWWISQSSSRRLSTSTFARLIWCSLWQCIQLGHWYTRMGCRGQRINCGDCNCGWLQRSRTSVQCKTC